MSKFCVGDKVRILVGSPPNLFCAIKEGTIGTIIGVNYGFEPDRGRLLHYDVSYCDCRHQFYEDNLDFWDQLIMSPTIELEEIELGEKIIEEMKS